MEENRSPYFLNYGYKREPFDRIPSRQFSYQGQPYDQRISSMQNSFKREPSEQRISSRQNSYLGEPTDQRISREYNYKRRPYDQRIPTRQNSYREELSEQRIPSRLNNYHGQSSDERIPSRQYRYQGPPYDERIPPRQYNYQGQTSDERISSRQYSNQGLPNNERIPPRQYNYQGQPSDERISSRQYHYQDESPGERIISRQTSDFKGVNQLMNNQQPTLTQYPGQYEGPHVYYVPGQEVYIAPTNGQAISPPGDQYKVRATTTPMPTDNDDPMMLYCVYSLRVVSALCLFLDICLSWIQVAALNGSTDVPGWLNFLESDCSISYISYTILQDISPELVNQSLALQRLRSTFHAYIVFCAIATAFGLFRIINTVGETLIEYYNQHPSESEPRFRGFQIIHGWVETVLGMLCGDIPQAVLLLCFNLWCKMELNVMAKMFVWYLIKIFKIDGRLDSCKHHYKFRCKCESKQNATEKCCVYSLNFCCKIYYFRPCVSGDQQCCETKSFDIGPDFNCSREGKCCGEIKHDPEWARNLYFKLSKLHSVLFFVILLLPLIKHFTRVLDLP